MRKYMMNSRVWVANPVSKTVAKRRKTLDGEEIVDKTKQTFFR